MAARPGGPQFVDFRPENTDHGDQMPIIKTLENRMIPHWTATTSSPLSASRVRPRPTAQHATTNKPGRCAGNSRASRDQSFNHHGRMDPPSIDQTETDP